MHTTLIKKSQRFDEGKVRLHDIATPLDISVTPSRYFARKSAVDFCLALLLLLPGLPLMAVAIVLVRLSSRGPAIFRQDRTGRYGNPFRLYKIRSMKIDAEVRTGPAWTQPADPRITRVGYILRKFHLDELPQLFNVLKGDMSLVGPRPERPEFVGFLERQLPAYANRLAVRPGITGLAQLNLPPDSDVDSVQRKVILDIEYIQSASLWLDVRLIVCTALRFLKLPILGLFGLARYPKLSSPPLEEPKTTPEGEIVTLQGLQQKAGCNHSGDGSRGCRSLAPNRADDSRTKKPR